MNQPPPEAPRRAAINFEIGPVGRRRRGIDPGWIVAALVAVLLLAAITHPWQSTTPASAVALSPDPASPAAVRSLVPGGQPAASPGSSNAPIPVVTQGGPVTDQIAIDIGNLGEDQGAWGVGVGAPVGPPLQPTLEIPALGVATEQAWWTWIVVPSTPAASMTDGSADAVQALPVDRLCTGVPDLPTGGQVLVVTTPRGTRIASEFGGWQAVGWHDEPRDVESIQFNGLVISSSSDVSYIKLDDGRAWPDGRYEFHVDESGGTNLTVCLGRP